MSNNNSILKKIKEVVQTDYGRDIYLSVIIIATAVLSFGLGRLSYTGISELNKSNSDVVKVDSKGDSATLINQSASAVKGAISTITKTVTGLKSGPIVASKNGAKYYFLNCSGVSRIKEENKIYFNLEDEAKSAGYEKSATCK